MSRKMKKRKFTMRNRLPLVDIQRQGLILDVTSGTVEDMKEHINTTLSLPNKDMMMHWIV